MAATVFPERYSETTLTDNPITARSAFGIPGQHITRKDQNMGTRHHAEQ